MSLLVSFALQCRKASLARFFATAVGVHPHNSLPQTVIEKVVQRYAVGLADGKFVKAGDYVMIRPQHVMTHDNTGPVISKCVRLPPALAAT